MEVYKSQRTGFTEVRTSGYPAIRMSEYTAIRISGYPDFRPARYPDFQAAGFPDTRIFGFPANRVSRYPAARIPAIRISGCPDNLLFFACLRCRLKSNRTWIYVALSRPPSLAQLISIGLPEELRSIIEGGPPEGILSRFCDMFKEKEDATHLRAEEVMRELGWDATG